MNGTWTADPLTWEQVQELKHPVFMGPPAVRPLYKRAILRALGRPIGTTRALTSGLRPRDVLALMAWLDTATFFAVEAINDLTMRTIPLPRPLRNPRARRDASEAQIGVAMICQNEQAHLPAALDSVVDLASQIVIVDGGSTDATVEIARSYGAEVYERRFDLDFATQRNYGLDKLRTDWALRLDADECVQPGLAALLRRAAHESNAEVVFVPRLNLITESGQTPVSWPDMEPILFRSRLRYTRRIHETVRGWSRAVYLPLSGPYLVHQKNLERHYRASLLYSTVDPDSYSPEWLEMARMKLDQYTEESSRHAPSVDLDAGGDDG